MVRDLPASAGDMGSIPGPGRFHLPWSSLSLQLLKPVHLEPVLCIKRSRRNEKLAQGSWRAASAHRRQRKPVCRSKDPAWPRINKQVVQSREAGLGGRG